MIKRTSTSFIVLCCLMLFGNAAGAFADAGEIADWAIQSLYVNPNLSAPLNPAVSRLCARP